jgi:hypothetical protein
MIEFFYGITAMGCLAATLFFVKFWIQSRDRLFLTFGIAFFVFALNRILLSLVPATHEATTYIYVLRLGAFLLIIFAVIDKNVSSRRRRIGYQQGPQ